MTDFLKTTFAPDVLLQFRGVYPSEQPNKFEAISQQLECIVKANAENAEHCRNIRQIDADDHAQFPWMPVPDRPAMDAFLANKASADALMADTLYSYAKERQLPADEVAALVDQLRANKPNYQPQYRPFTSEQSIESQIQAIFSKSTALGNEMTKESLALNRQRNGDLQNVRTIMANLRVAIAGKKDEDGIDVKLPETDSTQLDPDSVLGQEHAKAQAAMKRLLNDPAVKEFIRKNNLDPATVSISRDGKLWGTPLSGSGEKPPRQCFDLGNIALEERKIIMQVGLGVFADGGTPIDAVLDHYGIKPSCPDTVGKANITIEALKGLSDSLSSNAQTQMLELQQVVSKTNEKYSQWASLYDKIQQSKQGLIR